jgi:hypothetical protein
LVVVGVSSHPWRDTPEVDRGARHKARDLLALLLGLHGINDQRHSDAPCIRGGEKDKNVELRAGKRSRDSEAACGELSNLRLDVGRLKLDFGMCLDRLTPPSTPPRTIPPNDTLLPVHTPTMGLAWHERPTSLHPRGGRAVPPPIPAISPVDAPQKNTKKTACVAEISNITPL